MKNSMKVTKQFKKDLKKADTIVLRFNEKISIELKEDDIEKKGWIKPGNENIYTYEPNTYPNACFVSMYCKRTAWTMLAGFIKVDDDLFFHCTTNNNQYLDNANLFHDILYCTIYRNDKMIIDDYILESSICPDNSARAIKK